MQRFDQLTSRPKIIAAGLAVVVALWLLSGILGKKTDQAATRSAAPTAAGTMSVQFQSQVAQPVTRNLSVYGRTTPVRQVELKAETSGRVSELGVRRGALARSGDLLLKLDLRTLVSLNENLEAVLESLRIRIAVPRRAPATLATPDRPR